MALRFVPPPSKATIKEPDEVRKRALAKASPGKSTVKQPDGVHKRTLAKVSPGTLAIKKLDGVHKRALATASPGLSVGRTTSSSSTSKPTNLETLNQAASALKRHPMQTPEKEPMSKRPMTGVLVTITAPSIVGRKGELLPQLKKIVSSQEYMWKIIRQWAKDVLQLPECKMPGGTKGGAEDMDNAGVLVFTRRGARVHLRSQLSEVVASALNVELQVHWPRKSLPKWWGEAPQKREASNVCTRCGSSLQFRKVENDSGSYNTLAFCENC